MTPAAVTAPPDRARVSGDRGRGAGRRAVRLFEPSRATLDDRITALWQELGEAGRADCPVCDSELVADGACGGCGSELS